MAADDTGLTAAQLIEMAATHDHDVTPVQLARWHRATLLPRPSRRFLGRGRGSESVYPPAAGDQLLALCAAHATDKRLSHVGFRLWWTGYPVPVGTVRDFLVEVAERWEDQVAALEGADRAVLAVQARDARLPQGGGRARKLLGREQFPRFVEVLLDVAQGRFDGGVHEDQNPLLDKVVALGPIETDHREALAALSQALGQHRLPALLADMDDQELSVARAEITGLLALVEALAPTMAALYGQSAAGFRLLAGATADMGAPETAALLLLWAALRRQPAMVQGMQEVLAAGASWGEHSRAWQAIDQLRREVPAAAKVLSTRRLRAAVADPKAMEHHQEALRKAREADPGAFDAFFIAHPEYRPTDQGGDALV